MTHDHRIRRRDMLFGLLAPGLPAVAGGNPLRLIRAAALFSLPFEQLWVSGVHSALKAANDRGALVYAGYENIAPTDYPDRIRQLAQSGVEVIFGESYEQETEMRKLARQFPKVAFVWGSLQAPQAPNFSVFDNHIHEPAYLAGMLAGGFSRHKHVGVVAGFDMPDIRQIMHAFFAGAKETAPSVRFSGGVIDSWYNPVRAHRMANTLIDQGADVLLAMTHSGVVETAVKRHVHAINCMANQQNQYPNTVIAAVLWHMEPVVQAVIHKLRSGTYRAEDYGPYALMRAGGSSLSPLGSFAKRVSPVLLERVRAKEAAILSGQFSVPISSALPAPMKRLDPHHKRPATR